jgi:hypothetical protein
MADTSLPGKTPRIELAVMSRPALKGTSFSQTLTPGHIMIAVSVAGVGEEAWGFYNEKPYLKDEILVGQWHRYTTSSVIPITGQQYRALKAAIAGYQKSHDYGLLSTNCRHFVTTVLAQAGIRVPEETLWPSDQGKLFMKMYGESWGQCLGR